MIVTIAFHAAHDKRDQLVETLQSILPDTRAFNGCNSVILVESTETEGQLLLIEDWESAADYDAYKAWRRESGTTVLGSDMVDSSSLESRTFDLLA